MDVSAATARSSNDSERDQHTDGSKAVQDGRPSHDTSRTSAEENKFQGAISAWRSQLTHAAVDVTR